ncbi:MAG TPA: histidine kinase [Microbacteriaceae bacterium]
MRLTAPRLSEWVVAAAIGVSILVFLLPATEWAAVIAPLSAIAVLGMRQLPVTAAVSLAALQLGYALLQVPSENPAALAPGIVALYSLGRYCASLTRGPIVAVIYLLTALVAIEFTLGNIIFGTMLFGSAYAFGCIVRRRSTTARRARRDASALEAIDVDGLAAGVVADERARLGGQALGVIRSAVDAMMSDAAAASAELDPQPIDRITERGRAAITELRWLLGLLRTENEPALPRARVARRYWITDFALILVLLALTLLDGQIPGEPTPTPLGWVLLLALPLTLLLRRAQPVAGCLIAALLVGALSVAGVPVFIGTAAGALVTLCLLAWSVAVCGSASAWAGLAALVAATLWPVLDGDPQNIPMLLVMFGLPGFAGHEWSAQDHEARHAHVKAATLQAGIDAHVERAVREERLRIARDLHDVTSHAVGIMVLQASAAQALRTSDVHAARRAPQIVTSAGSQALSELTTLFDLLDAGAIGAPGLAQQSHESLQSLIERMRAAGMRIRVVDAAARDRMSAPSGGLDSPISGSVEQITYRVVQEALTNVARHAPLAAVVIRVAATAECYEISVTNGGCIRPPDAPLSGFGLAGLAERVRASAGAFAAGPEPNGGYRVWARIPLRHDQAAAAERATNGSEGAT